MNKWRSSRKGQLFALDMIFSVIGFTILLIVILSIWNMVAGRFQDTTNSGELHLAAFQSSDVLLQSRGWPTTWEHNVSAGVTVGLMQQPGELSETKLNAFMNLGYNETKKSLNIERFEYLLQIKETNGTTLHSKGITPSDTHQRAIAVTRLTQLNNETIQIYFTLWEQ